MPRPVVLTDHAFSPFSVAPLATVAIDLPRPAFSLVLLLLLLSDYLADANNSNAPVQPPKQSFPSQSQQHQAMVAAQYPGNASSSSPSLTHFQPPQLPQR